MSEEKKKDPLLVTAKVGTILFRIGLIIGMIAIGIAGAAAVFSWGFPIEGLQVTADRPLTGDVIGAILMVLVITMASLGLAYDFVTRLARIIDTVGAGDPFTLENADRLTRMGWTAIAIQVIAVPTMLLSEWLEPQMADGTFSISSDFSFTGIALAVVLFILARVFRKGTDMRDDLEGTV